MDYAGKDNLDVMEAAKNYNAYLLQMVCRSLCGHERKILDFGAGTGAFAKQLQQQKPDVKVIALEPADNLDAMYCDKVVEKISSLQECEAIDLIYSFNVLEHIEDDVASLKEMYCVLSRKGKLCLFVPAFPCLYSAMDKKVGHYRRYTRKELIAKVENAGFRVTCCVYKDFCGWFATLVYKWLNKGNGAINPKLLKCYDKVIVPVSILCDKITGGRICGKNLWLEAEK